MRAVYALAGLVASATPAAAAIKGFNTGAFFMNQQAKQQIDFEAEYNRAKNIPNTSGWTSVRLYSMVQWGTANDIIAAIPAAVNTGTHLLLGMWASVADPSQADAAFANELTALSKAIDQYGDRLAELVEGISVGSEDLYRVSPTGIANESGPGAQPETIIKFIQKVRDLVKGTALEGKPIGHVDTWTAWVDPANTAVISACDFLGTDAYPYFQNTQANSIDNAKGLFFDALDATRGVAQGKPVWVTETGWPVNGETENQAVPSKSNAERYWSEVACSLAAEGTNVYWYMLQESQYGQASPDFGVYGAGDLSTLQPYYDLSC